MHFSLQFENDEGDYVGLNSSDELSLRVAITSTKNIPGTGIRRLKLRLFVGSSPSINKTEMKKTVSESNIGARRQAQTRISLKSRYSKNELKIPAEKRTANTFGEQFDGELSNDSEDDTDCNDLFEGKTPLQRYALNTEKKYKKSRC